VPKPSAGLLGYRHHPNGLEFLLAHHGGPLWAHKDEGAWTLPKGEFEPGEEPLDAAIREYAEETGFVAHGPYLPLGSIRQKSGKVISAWAFETDVDAGQATSNTFEMEWPPHSGRTAEFPEVDRAAWFTAEEARRKLPRGQFGFIEAAVQALSES